MLFESDRSAHIHTQSLSLSFCNQIAFNLFSIHLIFHLFLFSLSFHFIHLCLFTILCFLSLLVRSSYFFLPSILSLSHSLQLISQIEYNKSLHCTNLSSVNDDDLLFDWISEWFVKMFLKYAKTWTWWAMQTDIYQQTIVYSEALENEQMKRFQQCCDSFDHTLARSLAHSLTSELAVALEHGIWIKNFDKKRLFGLSKVIWKQWTMGNVPL